MVKKVPAPARDVRYSMRRNGKTQNDEKTANYQQLQNGPVCTDTSKNWLSAFSTSVMNLQAAQTEPAAESDEVKKSIRDLNAHLGHLNEKKTFPKGIEDVKSCIPEDDGSTKVLKFENGLPYLVPVTKTEHRILKTELQEWHKKFLEEGKSHKLFKPNSAMLSKMEGLLHPFNNDMEELPKSVKEDEVPKNTNKLPTLQSIRLVNADVGNAKSFLQISRPAQSRNLNLHSLSSSSNSFPCPSVHVPCMLILGFLFLVYLRSVVRNVFA